MSFRRFFHFLVRQALIIAIFGVISRIVVTAEPATPVTRQATADVLWHGGLIGIFDHEARDTFASVEARLRWNWHGLRPWTGLTIVDSGAWFTGTGVIYDVAVSRHCRLTIGSGPFYYDRGRGDDLGFDLEFYSFVEASWVGKHDRRLGLRLGHLSNAGLGRENPGTETLSFVMTIPLGRHDGAGSHH